MNPARDDNEARLLQIEQRLAKLEEKPKSPPAPPRPPWLERHRGGVGTALAVFIVAVGLAFIIYYSVSTSDWYNFSRLHSCKSVEVVEGVDYEVAKDPSGTYRFMASERVSNCYDCDIGRVCK